MSLIPMVGNAIKNLFSRPATRLYPFEKREPFKGTRGSISIEEDKCIHCGICAKRCPADAITVVREKKTWSINHLSCVICSNCVLVCPKKCLNLDAHSNKALPASRQGEGTVTRQKVEAAKPQASGPEESGTGQPHA